MLTVVGQANAAKYDIKEVYSADKYRQSFAIDIDNQGTLIGAVRDSFNFPIYVEAYLTAETGPFRTYCALSDAELTSGEFDSSSIGCLKLDLARTTTSNNRVGYGSSPIYQKIGDYKSFYGTAENSTLINVFDFFDDDLGDFTNSNVEQIRSSNSNGIMVGHGTGPYSKISFQQTGENAADDPITMWQQDFLSRAVAIVDGNVTELLSEETRYGGYSTVYDISDSNFIAGTEAIGLQTGVATTLEENCTGELLPEQVCAWSIFRSSAFFSTRPVVWQVDNSGNIVSKTQYDLAFTPNENQTGSYSSRAIAVNDLGIAVGYGHVPYTDTSAAAQDFPLIFQNGTTTEMLEDHEDYDRGYALDINNNNLVVGNLDTYFDSAYNSEFFIYDLNSGELQTPTTFYSTAQSTASGINDNGVVVGQAEYEVTTSQTRRKHGFIYDSVKKEFFDLNDLTECNSVYEIVSTSAINNSNQIAATALKNVDTRDYKGEIIIDASTGEALQEQVAVAVLLSPIDGGELEECATEDEPDYKRKGLTLPVSFTILLSGLIAIRRKFL